MKALLSEDVQRNRIVLPPYLEIRHFSEYLCGPLQIEDYTLQAMDDASPPKWHLAHTSWFFETMLLQPYLVDYQSPNPLYGYLFNSYYNAVGPMHPRPQRGLLSRPSVDEIYDYRKYVDDAMLGLIQHGLDPDGEFKLQLGLHHEQQHQELLLTDIKYNFSINPLRPAYRATDIAPKVLNATPSSWCEFASELVTIGHKEIGFAFDNEQPAHSTYLNPFAIASSLVTNGEYLEFIEDSGYSRSEFWLSDGWQQCGSLNWQAPLYWYYQDNSWYEFNLAGFHPIDWHAPVRHVSFHEAYAYSRWRDLRLPTEAEWEWACVQQMQQPNPVLQQMINELWQWTESPYTPYPGYKPFSGQLAEYNGKFMSNQMVLRGGSCATPEHHIRATYRNFFYPQDRWQFSGIRLAKDL